MGRADVELGAQLADIEAEVVRVGDVGAPSTFLHPVMERPDLSTIDRLRDQRPTSAGSSLRFATLKSRSVEKRPRAPAYTFRSAVPPLNATNSRAPSSASARRSRSWAMSMRAASAPCADCAGA